MLVECDFLMVITFANNEFFSLYLMTINLLSVILISFKHL